MLSLIILEGPLRVPKILPELSKWQWLMSAVYCFLPENNISFDENAESEKAILNLKGSDCNTGLARSLPDRIRINRQTMSVWWGYWFKLFFRDFLGESRQSADSVTVDHAAWVSLTPGPGRRLIGF